MSIPREQGQEDLLHKVPCPLRIDPDHAEINHDDYGVVAVLTHGDQEIGGMGIGMEKSHLKELVEVDACHPPGQFMAIDPGGINRLKVVDFHAIYPLQDQQSSRDVLIIDAGYVNRGLILEHE